MTNITKAAPAMDTPALRELVTRLALEIDPEATLEAFPEALAFQIDMARAVIRAALQDKAGEVTVAIDNLYNERRDGMTNAIFPPVQIGTRLFAAQPAPVVPDVFALVPVSLLIEAEESVDDYLSGIGSGSHDRRVRENLQAAIAASQQKGGQ